MRREHGMTDIKDVRLLWFKGGLFLFLGCMAAGLLILQARNWTEVALLAVTIWAFCRAYYFAFYVIENYVDPSYRFAGLISFAQYAFAGRLSACQRHAGEGLDELRADSIANRREDAVYGIIVRWFVFALFVNVMLPKLTFELVFRNSGPSIESLLAAGWIAWLAVQVAVAVVLAAMLEMPLKFRLPTSMAALLLLAIAWLLPDRPNVDRIVTLYLAPVAFAIGCACLLAYRWRVHWTLSTRQSSNPALASSSAVQSEQVSIGYMLALTAAVSFALMLFKWLTRDISFLFDSDFFILIACGIVIEFFVVMVSILMMHAALSSDTKRLWEYVGYVALAIALFPSSIMFGFHVLQMPPIEVSSINILCMYVFFLSYTAMLLWVLLSFRKAGLRLIRSP